MTDSMANTVKSYEDIKGYLKECELDYGEQMEIIHLYMKGVMYASLEGMKDIVNLLCDMRDSYSENESMSKTVASLIINNVMEEIRELKKIVQHTMEVQFPTTDFDVHKVD